MDGRALGFSLYRWMGQYQDEIDEIVEDGWDGEWSPWHPHEESYVVDWYARHFETELEAHWTAQAKGRKPVLVENGQKVWASQFTGQRDVAYNLAYLRAVAIGLTLPEAVKAAENARNRARTPYKTGWQPNEIVVNATLAGLVTSRNVVIRWQKAPAMTGQMTVKDKEGLLATIRNVYR